MTDQTPGPGHNLPPIEEIRQRTDDLIAATDAWVQKVPEIGDEEQAGKASDLLDQLRKEHAAAKAEHKVEKQPHLDAGRLVDAAYKPITERLKKAGEAINALLTPWEQKKRAAADEARRKAEEKAKAEQEEADRIVREAKKAPSIDAQIAAEEAQERAEAAQKEAEKDHYSGTKGEFGKTVALRTTYRGEIADWDAALTFYSTDPLVSEAVAKAIARDIRGGKRVIPGVRIIQEQKAA